MTDHSQPITIKVKKEHSLPRLKNVLNLNDWKAKQPKKRRWLTFLVCLLIAAQAAAIGWLVFKDQQNSPYAALIDENAAVAVYLNHGELRELIAGLKERELPLFSALNDKIRTFISQDQLNSIYPILGQLADQSALIISKKPQNGQNSSFGWLFLGKKRLQGDLTTALTGLQQTLKKDYNFTSSTYRQTVVWQMKSLENKKLQIYFTQIKDFLLISDSEETLQKTIDKILE